MKVAEACATPSAPRLPSAPSAPPRERYRRTCRVHAEARRRGGAVRVADASAPLRLCGSARMKRALRALRGRRIPPTSFPHPPTATRRAPPSPQNGRGSLQRALTPLPLGEREGPAVRSIVGG